jgi:hypothetical protein
MIQDNSCRKSERPASGMQQATEYKDDDWLQVGKDGRQGWKHMHGLVFSKIKIIMHCGFFII